MFEGRNTLRRIPDGQTSSLCQWPLRQSCSVPPRQALSLPYTEPRPTSIKKFFIHALRMILSSRPNNPIKWVLLSLQMRKRKFKNLKSLDEDHTARK